MVPFLENRRLLIWSYAFIFIIYAVFLGTDMIYGINCWSTGIDFCAYWSSGKAGIENGVGGIYDLSILRDYQKAVYPKMFDPLAPYEYLPFPYFPIFSLPFLSFAKLPTHQSYLLWSAINFSAFVFYLVFFYRSTSGDRSFPWHIFGMILLSAPLFNNIKFGQLNIWLGICAGEFVRNSIRQKNFIAGLWLAGLLLKFQTLILILPFLLLLKNFRTILSFGLGLSVVLSGSFALVGSKGVNDFIEIISGSAAGDSAANVSRMTNWRMIGNVFDQLFGTNVGSVIMLLGAFFIIWLLTQSFHGFNMTKSEEMIIGYFLIFLATTLTTVHSHFEMNLLFYPFLLVAVERGWIAKKTITIWFWAGVIIFVLIVIIDATASYFDLLISSYRSILIISAPIGMLINLKIFFEIRKVIEKMKAGQKSASFLDNSV